LTAGTERGGAGLGTRAPAVPLRRRFWRLVGRSLAALETDAGGWAAMGAAMVASIALSLWLTRGTTFWFDEFTLYSASHGFDPQVLVTQHNGQLILLPRLIYAAVFALFGADYAVIRLIEAVGVALVGATVYALARPRIGALALAPAIVLLFFGFSWDSTLTGNGIINVYCLLPGLAAMLALERRIRGGDPLACLLLALSLASWSAGLGFVAGVAVIVMREPDRWRRVWVFAVPLALWGLWWIAKPGLSGPLFGGFEIHWANVLLIPNFAANSFAAVMAAVTGLNYDFSQTDPAKNGAATDTSWGPALAVVAVVGLVLALRRRLPRTWPWAWFAVLTAFWSAAGLASFVLRPPEAGRYVYVGAAAVLVLAADAIAGFRLKRRLAVVALGALAFALAANIAHLRDASAYLRTYATNERADLAAIEIARARVSPDFVPSTGLLSSLFLAPAARAGTYLAAVDRNGSFADTLSELRAAPEQAREEADQVLAQALRVQIAAAAAPRAGASCRHVPAAAPGAAFRLPRGGALIAATPGAKVALRRFAADYSVELGAIPAAPWSALVVPTDAAADPWWAQVATSQPVEVCPP
jgi:hypothetical protein